MANLRKSLGIAVLVVVAIGATSLFAQTTDLAGDALVRALIDEVRALRVSLQRNSAYELRGRLLIDRAKMHQETIRELSREVEGANEFLSRPMEVDMDMTTESTMVAAPAPGVVPNPEEVRRMQEREKEMMERRKAMEARHREQMRQRYQRVEQRLNEEREKLRAIEDELAEMQRELTAVK